MNEKQEFKPYIAPEKVTTELKIKYIIMEDHMADKYGKANK